MAAQGVVAHFPLDAALVAPVGWRRPARRGSPPAPPYGSSPGPEGGIAPKAAILRRNTRTAWRKDNRSGSSPLCSAASCINPRTAKCAISRPYPSTIGGDGSRPYPEKTERASSPVVKTDRDSLPLVKPISTSPLRKSRGPPDTAYPCPDWAISSLPVRSRWWRKSRRASMPVVKTGADLPWRAKKNIPLPCEKRLPDGSYLSRI